MQNERDWTPPTRDRSAHALPRREVLLAADARGIATIPAPRLARLAGVSTRTAWHWLNGRRVSTEMDRAIRDALRLPLRAA